MTKGINYGFAGIASHYVYERDSVICISKQLYRSSDFYKEQHAQPYGFSSAISSFPRNIG